VREIVFLHEIVKTSKMLIRADDAAPADGKLIRRDAVLCCAQH
jgi:hypothetical protein